MNVFEKAKEYYPKLWDKTRIRTLVRTGKLTKAQYLEITGEKY